MANLSFGISSLLILALLLLKHALITIGLSLMAFGLPLMLLFNEYSLK
jgi:hypothetical protein